MKILLKNIYKRFSNECLALENINLLINNKDVIVILGKSGSGKSTLLRVMTLLEKSTKGQIFFNDREVQLDKPNDLLSNIGMVFQQFNLFPHFNVEKNLTYAAYQNPNKISIDNIKDKAKKLLSKFNIDQKIDSFPKDLSGGEKQRVAICRALMTQPQIMLFDEPTSSLDIENIQDIINIIKKLKKEIAILIVTHDIKFAKIISDRIIFMDKGKILEDSKKEEFFNNPKSIRAKEFLHNVKNLI